MARVNYVTRESADPKIKEMFERWEADGDQVLNLYKIVAQCPGIGKQFMRLGNRILFQGKVPPKLREFAILKIGELAQAPYEFTKHVAIALKAGLTQAQIDALPNWQSASVYDEAERAVLQYTEEVSRNYRAADQTFANLRNFLDEEQTIELTIVIGFYEMVCRVLEALQIELEDEAFEPF